MRKNMFVYSSFTQSLGCMQMLFHVSVFWGYFTYERNKTQVGLQVYLEKESGRKRNVQVRLEIWGGLTVYNDFTWPCIFTGCNQSKKQTKNPTEYSEQEEKKQTNREQPCVRSHRASCPSSWLGRSASLCWPPLLYDHNAQCTKCVARSDLPNEQLC